MPGYAQFVEADTTAKMLAKMAPNGSVDLDSEIWRPMGTTAVNLVNQLQALADKTSGSQHDFAVELRIIAQDLVDKSAWVVNTVIPEFQAFPAGSAEANGVVDKYGPEIATIQGAARGVAAQMDRFDIAKLKRKRYIFG
jgi:hypothetical protein